MSLPPTQAGGLDSVNDVVRAALQPYVVLADREFDRRVAEEILGWTIGKPDRSYGTTLTHWLTRTGEPLFHPHALPSFSTSMDAVLTYVFPEMEKRELRFSLQSPTCNSPLYAAYFAKFELGPNIVRYGGEHASQPARALCMAAFRVTISERLRGNNDSQS